MSVCVCAPYYRLELRDSAAGRRGAADNCAVQLHIWSGTRKLSSPCCCCCYIRQGAQPNSEHLAEIKTHHCDRYARHSVRSKSISRYLFCISANAPFCDFETARKRTKSISLPNRERNSGKALYCVDKQTLGYQMPLRNPRSD